MAEVIRMPLLSDTMKEGVIAQWNVKVGDPVKSDDVIAEVETDKATMEVNPYVDGTVLYIAGDKGVAIPVNGIMAIIGDKDEDISALLSAEGSESPSPDSEEAKQATAADTPASEEKAQTAALPEDVTVVRMPLLSDTMKEGKIVAWLKNKGEQVKSDDVLAEVETDKATMEVIGYADGTLLHIGVPAGEAAQINEIIAIVGPEGTDISGILDGESKPKTEAAAAPEEKPETQKKAAATPAAPDQVADTGSATTEGGRVKISPLALSLAKDKGIDINTIQGSGDGGRIIKRDIDNYKPSKAAGPADATAAPASGTEGHTDTPLSKMRKIIAQRLSESKFQAPHFYLKMSIFMDILR